MLVVRLVEKHILAVSALGSPLLENALLVDAVLGAEALPEYRAHWGVDERGQRARGLPGAGVLRTLVAALAKLDGDDFARHLVAADRQRLKPERVRDATRHDRSSGHACHHRHESRLTL